MTMMDMDTFKCLRCGDYWASNCGPREHFELITRFCPVCIQIVSAAHLDLADPPTPQPQRRKMTDDMSTVFDLDRGFKIKVRNKKWFCYAPRHSGVGKRSTARQGWWYPASGRERAQLQIRDWMTEQELTACEQ